LSIISRPGTTEGAGVAGAKEATRRDEEREKKAEREEEKSNGNCAFLLVPFSFFLPFL
jgi:hypothetical protein